MQLLDMAEFPVEKWSMLPLVSLVLVLNCMLLWHMFPLVLDGLVAIPVSSRVMATGSLVENGVQMMPILLIAVALNLDELSVVGVAILKWVAEEMSVLLLVNAIAMGMAMALLISSPSAIALPVTLISVLVGVPVLSVNAAFLGIDVVVLLVPSANPGACPRLALVLLCMAGHSMPRCRVRDRVIWNAMAALLSELLVHAMMMAWAMAVLHRLVVGAKAMVLADVLTMGEVLFLLLLLPKVNVMLLGVLVLLLLVANVVVMVDRALMMVLAVVHEMLQCMPRPGVVGVPLLHATIGSTRSDGVPILALVLVMTWT